MGTDSKPAENGFEIGGTFYRWHVSDIGKDLMLIDRIADVPITEFYAMIEDADTRERGPVLLAMMATSIRHRFPDWSVERIARTVMNVNLSDVAFIGVDEEEDAVPLPSASEPPPSTGDSSRSESKSPSLAAVPETYETFNATPV